MKHLTQGIHLVGGDVCQSHGRNVAGRGRVVIRLDGEHGHLLAEHRERILQTLRDVEEDLRRRQGGRGHEAVPKLVVETDLDQGGVGRDIGKAATRGDRSR